LSHSSPFTIYNASAGSGKTFVLVKSFLKKLLTHSNPGYYKYILAITFTNKAVAEMKTRIINTLVDFSSEESPSTSLDMLTLIAEETTLSTSEIQSRARVILKDILHNYAQFSVETIDHFNHRLIRTFARDLNLSTDFEVSLDIPLLISQAVDQLIDKAGEDNEITKILLEFVLQKTDDDKSWDISRDLIKAASLLTNENDATHLKTLNNKSLHDFLNLRNELRTRATKLEKEIILVAQEIISLFKEYELDETHFDRKYLYRFFEKISQGVFNLNFDTAWQQNIGVKPMYPSRVTGEKAEQIDELVPVIGDAFQKIKQRVHSFFLLKNILRNLVPLSTVHLVNTELEQIKEEDNILPINEFNSLINDQIKDQPAPFIYERLGDRYRNFFIDEFQDTSSLQWSNLTPLIENALSQAFDKEEQGSLLLVGDAKQSIYRWRGGLPEQFIELYEGGDPFGHGGEKTVETLHTNYRSSAEIIDFNNQFFNFVSNFFGDQSHQQLYTNGTNQRPTQKKDGFVQIDFIEAANKEAAEDLYAQKTHAIIENVLGLHFQKKDICILTRKKREGIAISEYLLNLGFSIISEETLLLKNAPNVQCLIYILQLGITPKNEEIKIEFLEFLFHHLDLPGDKHAFFQSHIHESLAVISETLMKNSINFNLTDLHFLSLYESCEYCIEALRLDQTADAFLLSFMDLVFTFSQRPDAGKSSFFEYWEIEKERASISENKGADAIHVMTIHKAKGLEFPVVIFPYADLDLYREKEPTAWYPFHEMEFEQLLINYSSKVEDYGIDGAHIVSQRRNTLELDNINLLYVALTRAEQQLYILAKNDKLKSPPTSYNGFLKAFLLEKGFWNDAKSRYDFGTLVSNTSEVAASSINNSPISYLVSSPNTHDIKMVASEVVPDTTGNIRSVTLGNLLHDGMARVNHSEELNSVLEDLKLQLGDDPETFREVRTMMVAIVEHPRLKPLFHISEEVLNERDIISPERIIRPDRINIHPDKSVTIVDYKTGAPKEAHEFQINGYAMTLQDMGYTVKEKLLVYCDNDSVLINKT